MPGAHGNVNKVKTDAMYPASVPRLLNILLRKLRCEVVENFKFLQKTETPLSECSDGAFCENLARARKAQAEVWADEVKEISDSELTTHEAIGKARLQCMSRLALAGAYNSQFNTKQQGVQVAIGVSIALPEQERVKLIQRRDQAPTPLSLRPLRVHVRRRLKFGLMK
jgi:hypothetical protein